MRLKISKKYYTITYSFALLCLLSLSACISNQTPKEILQQFLGKDTFPPHVEAEIERFQNAYYAIAPRADEGNLDYFRFAFKRLRSHYVKPLKEERLINSAIIGINEAQKNNKEFFTPKKLLEAGLRKMVSSLDPHSGFMDAEEFRDTFAQTKGEFGGLGIQVTMEDNLVKVVAPIEDTPASRAGLKAEDLITHIDGMPIRGKTLSEAVRIMRGPPGKAILLQVRRKGSPEFSVRIVRSIIKVKAIRWSINGNIGYLRIIRFSERTQPELRLAIENIKTSLGKRLSGVVIDLRNNPGGLLDQSVYVTDTFLDAGEIVSIRGRTASNVRSYKAKKGDMLTGVSIVVLINKGSASASEIVASALQHHGRAVIMGRTSFGKGSVQTIMPLPIEGALRLTTALYYSPSGRTIQAAGVQPDIVLIKPAKKSLENQGAPTSSRNDGVPEPDLLEPHERPSFFETACPAVGENKDYGLGCALTYLDAGSLTQFRVMLSRKSGT